MQSLQKLGLNLQNALPLSATVIIPLGMALPLESHKTSQPLLPSSIVLLSAELSASLFCFPLQASSSSWLPKILIVISQSRPPLLEYPLLLLYFFSPSKLYSTICPRILSSPTSIAILNETHDLILKN